MKAIALISGGLDSILAAKIIKEQGIEIIPLNFNIPFCHLKKTSGDSDIVSLVKNSLWQELKVVDISNEFLNLVVKPQHGFGTNMNPCIDCKILMLSKAKELMNHWEAVFVVTGEVLGQRPMSQHRQALELIEKKSGLEGLVLRPLSARLLTETIPEKADWVDRNKLLNFSGRTRRPQMELAKNLDIEDYPNASGGCLLTDPQFAKRLKELIAHRELSLNNVELLKLGRHFRLAPNTKLVVGRNEKENEQLLDLVKENDYLFMPTDELAGPTALGRGSFNEELIKLSSSIVCRYCDLDGAISTDILVKQGLIPSQGTVPVLLKVSPIDEDKLTTLRV